MIESHFHMNPYAPKLYSLYQYTSLKLHIDIVCTWIFLFLLQILLCGVVRSCFDWHLEWPCFATCSVVADWANWRGRMLL